MELELEQRGLSSERAFESASQDLLFSYISFCIHGLKHSLIFLCFLNYLGMKSIYKETLKASSSDSSSESSQSVKLLASKVQGKVQGVMKQVMIQLQM